MSKDSRSLAQKRRQHTGAQNPKIGQGENGRKGRAEGRTRPRPYGDGERGDTTRFHLRERGVGKEGREREKGKGEMGEEGEGGERKVRVRGGGSRRGREEEKAEIGGG